MGQIYLVEITAATDISGTLTTLRYSSGDGYNLEDDYYEPRIQQAANLTREIFDDGRTFGASRVSYGELVLVNADGGLDAILEYGYGRQAKIMIGDEDADYNTFATVLDGTIEQPVADFDTVTFRFRDRQLELDRPIQPSKFLGNNSGSTGIEGLANDLKGKPKPRIWGVAKEVTPAPVNTTALIYAVNFNKAGATAAITSIDAVYDGGLALVLDTAVGTSGNCANLAALQAASITAGKYATCTSEGLIRLASTPARSITCDVTEGGGNASDRYAGKLIERVLLDAGVAGGNINASDITALGTDAPYETGYYVEEERTYRDVLDAIASSAGIWYSPDRLGQYRVKQLKAPSGTAALLLKSVGQDEDLATDEVDIVSIERLVTQDPGRGVPAWKMNLNYGRVWTVQQAGELAGATTDARRAYLAQELRSVTSEDSSIKDQFPLAPEINFDTLIVSAANAQTECNRRLALYKVLRGYYQVSIILDAAMAIIIDLGVVLEINLDRFGMGMGKKFIVTGITYDALENELILRLWG